MTKNLKRLIQLANEIFATKNDPSQIDVDHDVIERLKEIHPSTVAAFENEDGPVAWLIVIPTSLKIMEDFLDNKITEKQLLELTQPNENYEAVYLCSALVLEEFRRQQIIKNLTINAIKSIMQQHQIKSLYVWAFSDEGNFAAEKIAREIGLPLMKKK